jgi:hypothetical protein
LRVEIVILNKNMKKNKLFAIVLVIIVVLVVLYFSDSLLKPLAMKTAKNALHITAVSPSENELNVGLYHPVAVMFDQPVPKEQQSNFQLTLTPHVAVDQKWSADNKSVMLTPTSTMHSDQKYTVSVKSQSITYSWAFQTPKAKDVSLGDQLKSQEEGDKYDAEFNKAIYTTFPWFDQFPLQEKNYFVYYDVENKKLVGKLYPQKKASSSVDAQVNKMKSEIEARVKKIGVDSNQFNIEWQVNPE